MQRLPGHREAKAFPNQSFEQTSMPARVWQPSTLAPLAAVLSCFLFCCNSELLQALQLHSEKGGHASPLLNLTFCHLGGLLFAPSYGSYEIEPGKARGGASPLQDSLASCPRLASLLFALLLMCYNYAWLLSAKLLAASLTNAVFQVSVAFVYLASVFFFAEPTSGTQLLGVVLALMGSFLASNATSDGGHKSPETISSSTGIALALAAAVGYTLYQVLFRWVYGHLKQDVAFLAHFGAWISIWHMVMVLPLVLMADVMGFEALELPRSRLALLGTLASAGVASTVNALYLCIVLWGSPMLLPSISALSVPLTVALDYILHGRSASSRELVGQGLVLFSVILILELKPLRKRKDEEAIAV